LPPLENTFEHESFSHSTELSKNVGFDSLSLLPFDESVDEVDAGELHEGGEHGHEAQDHVDVHCGGVAYLKFGDYSSTSNKGF